MGYNNVYRPIVGVIKRNTEKAVLFVVENPEALTEEDATIENWIPKSQIIGMTPMKDAKGSTEVMMSEWIIGQKGLQAFVRKAASPAKPPSSTQGDMDDDIPY